MTDIAADRARLLEIVRAKAIVHGRVTLSSGKEADYYVDLRRITLDGEAARSSAGSCATWSPTSTSTPSAA